MIQSNHRCHPHLGACDGHDIIVPSMELKHGGLPRVLAHERSIPSEGQEVHKHLFHQNKWIYRIYVDL
jgi:hypothetical protein